MTLGLVSTLLPVSGLSPVLMCDAVGLVVLSPLLGRSATAPKHQQRLMLLAMVILDAITGIWMLLQYAYEVCINRSSLLAHLFLPLASNAAVHLISQTQRMKTCCCSGLSRTHIKWLVASD